MTTAPHPQQPVERPTLTLVTDNAPEAVEGTVVEQPDTKPAARPAWIQAARTGVLAARKHATDNHLYAGWVPRGYMRLARGWRIRHRDGWPQMIASAEAALQAAQDDVKAEDAARLTLEIRRDRYRQHRRIHWAKTGAWGATITATGVTGALTGQLWIDLLLGVAFYGIGAFNGRPGQAGKETTTDNPLGLSEPTLAAPQDAEQDEAELRAALAAAGFTNTIRVIDATPLRADGTREITIDLGGATTATELRKKTESIAAALKRDITMIDITKGDHLGQARIWLANADPFETARRTPLLDQHTPIDSWRDGIPIAYNKRGIAIRIAFTNQSAVIGGRSRSGKGVGASNLIVGAAMDPLVNLRIVAGKHNGEWDPYARAGIASTYFKPSPERLLALLKALLADKDRRERELGKLAKSKLIHGLIRQIGGVEVLVIDELATYTRPGKPLRDEILAAIEELSQVALGAGILLVLITQYPEVEVLPQAISMNCGTKWAMYVENATQSNAILGAGQAGAGRDASKFDPPRPGLGWLVDPFAGVTDLARSFDLDEDERGEITELLKRAATFREAAGRLAGQWDDPIEKALLDSTGLSSIAGGPQRDGTPGRTALQATPAQRQQAEAMRGALLAMDELGRDVAQTEEMAALIGGSMNAELLGKLLRDGGAGGTVKITIPGRSSRVNGYQRADIKNALEFLVGA